METKSKMETQKKEYKPLQVSSINCYLDNKAIQATYGLTARDFLTHINPSLQTRLCNDEERCYFGTFPSLGQLNEVYGKNTAKAWIIPELVDLSEYCGAREKITANQLSQCADIIACDYYYLKVSEMLLFFARFKRCRYGRFYGKIDPLIITEALREFCRERNVAYYNKGQSEYQNRLKESENLLCSWEQYARDSGQAGKPMPALQLKRKEAAQKNLMARERANKDLVHEIAIALVNNTYCCDEKTLIHMKAAFVLKYGSPPEDYVRKRE